MTKVFYASTLFGVMSLVAAIDSGTFGERDERRILITSNNAPAPEIVPSFVDSPSFETLRDRFDDLVSWNDFIAPMHPSGWLPPMALIPLLTRALRSHLGIENEVTELVLESIPVSPSRTIGVLIPECPITVYSDGLMSYGPTRDDLPVEIGRRTSRLLYLDLVPGVRPMLLRENDVAVEAIPDGAFLKVIAELPEPPIADAHGLPMIVGQYLSQLGLLTSAEETGLHETMLRGVVAAGHRRIVFKPHPAAGRSHVRPMLEAAKQLGVDLVVATDPLPAEAWFASAQPQLVVSCFSTALLTASQLFGVPAATTGCGVLLERLTPYENSNRIPTTIVDATVPELQSDGTLTLPPDRDLAALLNAVGYCMQAGRHPDLRADATLYLRAHGTDRYFAPRRIERLGLINVPVYRGVAVRRFGRRVARGGYRVARRMLERGRARAVANGRG